MRLGEFWTEFCTLCPGEEGKSSDLEGVVVAGAGAGVVEAEAGAGAGVVGVAGTDGQSSDRLSSHGWLIFPLL
jgi:hypothetical protein